MTEQERYEALLGKIDNAIRADEQSEKSVQAFMNSNVHSNDAKDFAVPYQDHFKQALRVVVEGHKPQFNEYLKIWQCQECRSLCHSETGLGCDWEGDALYPCLPIQAIEKELA